ncbi:hypothetical protein [Rhodoferax sp.]|uniref:hypothetical protein n=1 Tax=Rhodoferax sp. TaxID=50421 RepID=UPI0025F2200F|nr:hypothetical protein [Rhodoferax sp.]
MTKPAAPPPVGHPATATPPLGDWLATSDYGLLRSDKTDAGRLARLEDVLCWLATKEPRDTALQTVFSALVQDDGRMAHLLYVVNARTHAKPLVIGNQVNAALSGFWQYLPEVQADSSPETVARGVADAWDRVWPGLANPETDAQSRHERAIVRLAEVAAASPAGKARGDFVQSCPDDAFLLGLLRTLAVPLASAFDLWGYGTAPAAIDPPQDWLLHAPLGFMAYKEGNGGQLVRLADLLRWLEQTRSIPLAAAAEVLCGALPTDEMDWLYRVRVGDYAESVHLHATVSVEPSGSPGWAMPHQGRFHGVKFLLPGSLPDKPDLPFLLRLIRGAPSLKSSSARMAVFHPLDDVRSAISRLAIPVAKARALWGYGVVQAAEAAAVGVLDSVQLAQPNDWTAPGAIDSLRAEIRAYDESHKRGGKANAARRYNVKPQRITELLKVKAPKAATLFSGLGSSNSKKAA